MRTLLPLVLILSGCASASTVQTAKGSAYQIDCGGPFNTKLDCNVRASRICPAGFETISSPPGSLVFTCARRDIPSSVPAPI